MKTQTTTLALAAAAVLGFGMPAQAEHNDTHRQSRSGIQSERDDRPFLSRVFSWPGRAGRTIVRSPMIVGETLSGRREVMTNEGRFFAHSDSPDRERSMASRAGRTAKRSGEFVGDSARSTGRFVGDAARRSGDFAVRTGRTITHTPQIIGESLTGRREFNTRDGRDLSAHESRELANDRELVQHDGRGQRLYASTR